MLLIMTVTGRFPTASSEKPVSPVRGFLISEGVSSGSLSGSLSGSEAGRLSDADSLSRTVLTSDSLSPAELHPVRPSIPPQRIPQRSSDIRQSIFRFL